MRLGLFLGGLLVLLGIPTIIRVGRIYPDGRREVLQMTAWEYEQSLAFWASGMLVLVAFLVPSLWIGLALGWIACSLFLTHWAWAHKWLPGLASAPLQATAQLIVLAAGAGYAVLAHLMRPAQDLPVWSGAVVAWAAFNVWCFVRQERNIPLPAWLSHRRITAGGPNLGLMDNASELAWLMAGGTLSGAYLALHYALSPAWLPVLVPFGCVLVRTRNLSAAGALFAGLVALLWPFVPFLAGLLAVLGLPVVAAGLWHQWHENSWALRRKEWTRAWGLARSAHFLGFGPGVWENHRIAVNEQAGGIHQHVWAALHNDWLQGLVEVGVFPVACAAAYVVTAFWTAPATPEGAFGLASVAFTAAYGLLYYPLRVPSQTLFLTVGMGALGALGR